MSVGLVLRDLSALAARDLADATAPPKALYTSPDILALEQQHVFGASWLCAGRADEIPAPGDYMTYELGPQPVILIRGKDGGISARANTCRHRMMRLVEGRGRASRFTCPYHAWTYELTGELRAGPNIKVVKGFDKSSICLTSVRTEVFLGFIFVNLDNDAKPMDEWFPNVRTELESYIPHWDTLAPLEWVEIPHPFRHLPPWRRYRHRPQSPQ